MDGLHFSPQLLTIAPVVLIGAVLDFRHHRIPNALTYPAILAGPLLVWLPGADIGLSASLGGFALAFLPGLLLYATGAMGGGDVKLLAAVGSILGYPRVLDVMFYSILAGSALGLGLIIWQGKLLETIRKFFLLLLSLFLPGWPRPGTDPELHIPFGVAVALGTFWALLAPLWRVSGWLRQGLGVP